MSDMTNKTEPAMSPEEWTDVRSSKPGSPVWYGPIYGELLVDGMRACIGGGDHNGMLEVDHDSAQFIIALANATLPADDPRKITWAMVDALRDEIQTEWQGVDETMYPGNVLRSIMHALASYLPPRGAE